MQKNPREDSFIHFNTLLIGNSILRENGFAAKLSSESHSLFNSPRHVQDFCLTVFGKGSRRPKMEQRHHVDKKGCLCAL